MRSIAGQAGETIERFLKEAWASVVAVLHVQKSEAQTYTSALLNQARMSVSLPRRSRYSKGYAPVS